MVEFGNEICSMSAIGLSWDHVRTFNPLSRSHATGGHAFHPPLPPSLFPFLSLSLFRSPSLRSPLIFFSILALALACVSRYPTLSLLCYDRDKTDRSRVHRERSSAYRQNAFDRPHVWFIPARSTHQKYQIPLMNFWAPRSRVCELRRRMHAYVQAPTREKKV